jgi:hypothetical protein
MGRVSSWTVSLILFFTITGCCNQDFVGDTQVIGHSCSAYRCVHGRWPQSVPEISEGAATARLAFDPPATAASHSTQHLTAAPRSRSAGAASSADGTSSFRYQPQRPPGTGPASTAPTGSPWHSRVGTKSWPDVTHCYKRGRRQADSGCESGIARELRQVANPMV